MPAYTGPTPKPPTDASSPQEWANWWAYQILLKDLRWEDWRLLRAPIEDQQHKERMAAEAGCQEANRLLATAQTQAAAAQKQLAENLLLPTPASPRSTSDADLLLTFVERQLAAGKSGSAVMTEARVQLQAYRNATVKIFPAPK